MRSGVHLTSLISPHPLFLVVASRLRVHFYFFCPQVARIQYMVSVMVYERDCGALATWKPAANKLELQRSIVGTRAAGDRAPLVGDRWVAQVSLERLFRQLHLTVGLAAWEPPVGVGDVPARELDGAQYTRGAFGRAEDERAVSCRVSGRRVSVVRYCARTQLRCLCARFILDTHRCPSGRPSPRTWLWTRHQGHALTMPLSLQTRAGCLNR